MKPIQKLSKELPFIKDIENLKSQLDTHRPLEADLKNKIFQKLRLEWNYNTNAIEGNSFTRGETVSLLMEGITAKGKPLKDATDITGHDNAIDFMMAMIKEDRDLTEADIRSLHKIVLGADYYNPAETAEGNPTRKLIKGGVYKTQPNHVKTGTGAIHYYASVEDTPIKMKELVDWYNSNSKEKDVNPIVLASLFHHKFVAIHPFDDGNGRMTRILTNFVLLKFEYPVSVIKEENRKLYYAALSQADKGEIIPIIEMISETVKASLVIYFKAINGEDIAEVDDLDKEIKLFKKEIGVLNGRNITLAEIDRTKFLFDLLIYPSGKLFNFADIFNNYSELIRLTTSSGIIKLNNKRARNIDYFQQNYSKVINSCITFSYEFGLSDYVYEPQSKTISVILIIELRRLNYFVKNSKEEILLKKNYNEVTIDSDYKKIISDIIKEVMIEIKN